MQLQLLVLTVMVVVVVMVSHPTHTYGLACPDGSVAQQRGLHACCGDDYTHCVLCARISRDYATDCVANCMGSLTLTTTTEPPYCGDEPCFCRPSSVVKEQSVDPVAASHGCPFLSRRQQQQQQESFIE